MNVRTLGVLIPSIHHPPRNPLHWLGFLEVGHLLASEAAAFGSTLAVKSLVLLQLSFAKSLNRGFRGSLFRDTVVFSSEALLELCVIFVLVRCCAPTLLVLCSLPFVQLP